VKRLVLHLLDDPNDDDLRLLEELPDGKPVARRLLTLPAFNGRAVDDDA
jgi:hypothetical protein